jgi:hypothetical protein
MLPIPFLALQLCSLACILGALDGAYGLISPRGAARGPGIELAEGASLGPLRALAGGRLVGHAAVLSVLWTAPSIGACLAAGLGCVWLGAAAGRAISIALEHRKPTGELLRVAAALAMGLILWWPLWRYLRVLEVLAAGGFIT